MATEEWKDLAAAISDCDYLFLRWIGEPEENRLRLIVEEAKAQIHKTPSIPVDLYPELKDIFSHSSPIESDSDCRLFEVNYNEYISYTITNEVYGKFPQSPEIFTGKLFREFQWSYLLEWTKKVSNASDEYPGPNPLRHHEIVCQNHVIEVISTRPPIITLIGRDGSEPPHLLH